jgi:hypothetical protein
MDKIYAPEQHTINTLISNNTLRIDVCPICNNNKGLSCVFVELPYVFEDTGETKYQCEKIVTYCSKCGYKYTPVIETKPVAEVIE